MASVEHVATAIGAGGMSGGSIPLPMFDIYLAERTHGEQERL